RWAARSGRAALGGARRSRGARGAACKAHRARRRRFAPADARHRGDRRRADAGAAQAARRALRPPPRLRTRLAASRRRAPAAGGGYSRLAVARVLLIEDDARLAAMVSEYLGGAGYRVTLAPSGESGLERLARESYDALVLDLSLPDIDGLEVCRRLRARWELPVLMLTARGEAMDRIVGLEIGADDYLPKPFE